MNLIENAKLVFSWDGFFIPFIDLNFVSFFVSQANPEVKGDSID